MAQLADIPPRVVEKAREMAKKLKAEVKEHQTEHCVRSIVAKDANFDDILHCYDMAKNLLADE